MMDYPEYVPPAVRTYITTQIEGNKGLIRGRAAILAGVELRLTQIKRTLEEQTLRGEDESLGSLRKEKYETEKN